MSRPRRRLRSVGLAGITAAGLATGVMFGQAGPPEATAQTLDDLDDARDVVAGVEDELGAVTAEYERTREDIELARRDIAALREQAGAFEEIADTATELLGDRARSAFKRGTTATFQTLLDSEGPQATVERAGLLAALQVREQVRIEDAVAGRVALDQTLQLVRQRERELEGLQSELEDMAVTLQQQLDAAQADAQAIASLVSRQRRIDRGGQQGIYSCIFDPGVHRFRDTWGAPRSGGRSHKGTDVFAAYGAPVFAITSGVVERHSNSGLGGLGLYLRGDDGNQYYYAHLDSTDPAGQVGNRVTAGEQIARNGSSGNADRWAPHVHFELHPGGGGAINPYPWLAAACR